MNKANSWRLNLYNIIFFTDTPAGKRFDYYLLWLIFASLVVVILDSINKIHLRYSEIMIGLELLFTGLFTLEYIVRIYCSPKPWKYILSFYGLTDLFSIAPGLLFIFFPDVQYLLIIRVIRMLRIFRVFQLSPYLKQASFLMTALRGSFQKIVVFFAGIAALVTIFGTIMYVVEGPEHGFTSIPKGIYWAIVTLTTVGFGDIVPSTPLGQAISSLVMITGYSIIAVPTGIFTAELATGIKDNQALKTICSLCSKEYHEKNAAFCNRCGSLLFTKDD